MKKAGDLLQNFLDEKIMKKAKEYSEFFASWAAVAGDQCSAHSRISDLKGTLLIVEADHPGWVQILQTRQAELLSAVQKRNPKLTITGISFRLSKGSNHIQDEMPKMHTETIPEDDEKIPPEQSKSNDLYEQISDEDFKASLKRLEESIKARNKR